MAQGYKLWKECESCHGVGVVMQAGVDTGRIIEIECPRCVGKGYYFWGWCTADAVEMPDMGE